MKLTFLKKHKSIDQFNQIELEDFTILTGYNGSGKSHLLESIKNGSTQIDEITNSEVVSFDFKTFYLENEQAFSTQQINKEKTDAWTKLNQNSNPNIKNQLINFKNQLTPENYTKIKEIAAGKPFHSLLKKDFGEEENLFEPYVKYKQQVGTLFSHVNLRGSTEAVGLKSMALSLTNTLDELSEDDFFDFYKPIVLKNDFLPSQIGKLFIDYWYKYQIFEYRKVKETGSYEKDKFRPDFEKIYGPRPWVLIDEILQSFQSFQYTINNPENLIIEPDRVRNFTFNLTHKHTKVSIPFDNLSSGEKILFSLVLSIYKGKGDQLFPSILLLDEIDASLHPSQIQNLLSVINEVFIKQNNVKVIIATHSPSTVALAEEKNIFIVNSSGANRIEKQSKKNAMKILSEGFITLEEGMSIFNEIAKKDLTIFTEGNNISYIEKSIRLRASEIIDRIEIVDKLKDRTGKSQLSVLSDFFHKLPHKNKVLFVYDCDVTKSINETGTTFEFIFPQNQKNNKVLKGIENLFSEDLFCEDFYPPKPKDDGGFQSSLDKKKFEEHLMQRNNPQDFENFDSLIGFIKTILENKAEA